MIIFQVVHNKTIQIYFISSGISLISYHIQFKSNFIRFKVYFRVKCLSHIKRNTLNMKYQIQIPINVY